METLLSVGWTCGRETLGKRTTSTCTNKNPIKRKPGWPITLRDRNTSVSLRRNWEIILQSSLCFAIILL